MCLKLPSEQSRAILLSLFHYSRCRPLWSDVVPSDPRSRYKAISSLSHESYWAMRGIPQLINQTRSRTEYHQAVPGTPAGLANLAVLEQDSKQHEDELVCQPTLLSERMISSYLRRRRRVFSPRVGN